MKIFITLFIFFGFLACLKPLLLNKSYLKLFRIFFPSWRFFEALRPIPKVYYRLSHDGELFSEWLELDLPAPCRRPWHLLHNPEENLALATQVQTDQLLNDIAEGDKETLCNFHQLSSYQIVSAHIKNQLQARHPHFSKAFQFKIGVWEFSHGNHHSPSQWSDSLISPPIEV